MQQTPQCSWLPLWAPLTQKLNPPLLFLILPHIEGVVLSKVLSVRNRIGSDYSFTCFSYYLFSAEGNLNLCVRSTHYGGSEWVFFLLVEEFFFFFFVSWLFTNLGKHFFSLHSPHWLTHLSPIMCLLTEAVSSVQKMLMCHFYLFIYLFTYLFIAHSSHTGLSAATLDGRQYPTEP